MRSTTQLTQVLPRGAHVGWFAKHAIVDRDDGVGCKHNIPGGTQRPAFAHGIALRQLASGQSRPTELGYVRRYDFEFETRLAQQLAAARRS
jgi:hypothetical protein